MTVARRVHFRPDITPWYHCVTRCVRRSFLCGFDKLTGKDLNHRRDWIEKRVLLLADVFCIDVAAYAVMSNHYQLVVRVNTTEAESLIADEIIHRWRKLYKGPPIVQCYLEQQTLSTNEQMQLDETHKPPTYL